MRALRIVLLTVLLISALSVIAISKKIYAADTGKGGSTIKSCQDKIAVERDAILEDEHRLQEAKKAGDKANIEQVRQETILDIAKRKSAIRALYREIGSKTSMPYEIDYKRKKK